MDIGGRYYPATLYYAAGGRLKIVREVISGTEGVGSVLASTNAIFLTHPLSGSSERSVNIIHTREPLKDDDVTFNGDFSVGLNVSLAETRPAFVDELLPVSKDFSAPLDTTLVSVSSDESAPDSRVTHDMWNEYANLRREGDPGGPAPGQNFLGAVIGENLVFPPAFGHPVVIDSLSASVRAAAAATALDRFLIIAANQRYMLLRLMYAFPEITSGKMGPSMEVFIHDRVRDRWKTIVTDGNTSRSRLFGLWLATVVQTFSYAKQVSPGREDERNLETDRLPSVRALYSFSQSHNWIPKVLLLQNIEDGRKIRIETNQEGSEIRCGTYGALSHQ